MRSSALPDTLPMLDLALFDAEGQERDAFLARLRLAAHDIGFFYLTGHGIDPDLLRQVQAVAMIHSPHFRGYNRAASERTRGQPDWREQFDLGAERPALPRDVTQPAWTRLRALISGRRRCRRYSRC